MLVSPGGKERTASEYEELFARAGLKMTRIVSDEIALQRDRSGQGCVSGLEVPSSRRWQEGIGVGQDAPASPLSPLRESERGFFLVARMVRYEWGASSIHFPLVISQLSFVIGSEG